MLKKRIEFLRTYKTKPVFGKFFKIYSIPNQQTKHRLGVTIPKTVDKAVFRNKYKRWVKEIFKACNKDRINSENYKDIHVFIKKEKNEELRWVEFKKELKEKLEQVMSK